MDFGAVLQGFTEFLFFKIFRPDQFKKHDNGKQTNKVFSQVFFEKTCGYVGQSPASLSAESEIFLPT